MSIIKINKKEAELLSMALHRAEEKGFALTEEEETAWSILTYEIERSN